MTDTATSFFQDTSFDPETAHIMDQAFECAFRTLRDFGQPVLVKDIIAKRIMDIARTGERDPNRLCNRALQAFGLPPQRD